MLSEKLIDELKVIIEEDYGKNLSRKELSGFANSLVTYFKSLDEIRNSNKNKYEYEEDKN